MNRLITSVAVGSALLVAATAQAMAPSGTMRGMTMKGASETIPLNAQNGSGETGSATLRDTAQGLLVTLHVKNAKVAQPAHIHQGSCAKLNPVPEYPLHNVVNGVSVTTVKGITIAQINGKSAINVHKSLTDIPHYVSCGDVAARGAM